MKRKFEDCILEINREINKQRNKWTTSFWSFCDFEDVAQTIRVHIYNKWSSWDQERPLGPWCATIISNQIKNLIRNNFASHAKPCIRCPFSQGEGFDDDKEGLCAITTDGTQCSECPLFARWEKTKKSAHNVKTPISLEAAAHTPLAETLVCKVQEFDFEGAFEDLNKKIKEKLKSAKMYKAYEMLFVLKNTDEEVAKFMGYKTTEKNRAAGYKQIRNLKNKFKNMAKLILSKKDLFNE